MSEWRDDDEPEVKETTAEFLGGVVGSLVAITGMTFLAERANRREERRVAALAAAADERRFYAERRARQRQDVGRFHHFMRARNHRYWFLATGAFLGVGAIFLTIFFTYTEKVRESGHLWWKEKTTTQIPFDDRLPLLLIGGGLVVAAALTAFVAFRSLKLERANEKALAGVKAARKKRAKARALATRDPQLARELGIGRPDLSPDYDDGGLLDINGAPAETIAAVLGVSREQAEHIISIRRQVEGFGSLEDLVALAGLEPRTLDRVSDRILVL